MTIATANPMSARVPGAKIRILETATALFYGDGIRTVGVDRLIGESVVTKATFYKHYGSKDRLIVDYISLKHETAREQLESIIGTAESPEIALRAIVADIVAEIARPGFRGCAFINAAAEFPDANHPVRAIVASHRDWYTSALADLLTEVGHPMPGDAADELVLARDGAMTGGYGGDPIAASAALQRVADRVIRAAVAR